ncbi:SUF system Fe-S cluster assembly protein [Thiorhodovibrio frisius]|uniref:FeS assembly SUF system protein n=1 Tax=Thiorhodovibrio frisius TaxID=631362 RepID=H8Z4V3_9GAMM|nr:SUF system Fe-S cluster assembly protein [Thiorhodovibrio frisius]EIC20360.1 FeS assembly SUF system protein [Thiorhodovibrio frisius]WPL21100.1 FeS assembly SUF system protein [Thiorhodovibrio frisius]
MNRLARFTGFGRDKQPTETDDTAGVPSPEVPEVEAVVEQMDAEELREPIIAALRRVHDPEIPVNIYDLGLIYKIDIASNGNVDVDMTLTAAACPVAGMMPLMVKDAVQKVEGVGQVEVELVWDPPWSQDNMSEEALLQLGMM